jgi:hypothetical protein
MTRDARCGNSKKYEREKSKHGDDAPRASRKKAEAMRLLE